MIAESPYNIGIQPLDHIMTEAGLSNHALVAVSTEALTHKVIQKARKGRKLTRRTQDKVLRALNLISTDKPYLREQIFNYEGS